ncbi:MAG: M4 family metallopeptidase [Eubacterium sp.]|nr:M4 family metallopeptidase [Eubacterium sp.]
MIRKRQKLLLKKLSAVLLVMAMVISSVSCGKGKAEDYSSKQLATEAFDIADSGDYRYTGNTAKQLTEQDIQNMNNGNAIIVYDDNHQYVTTIIGKFYEEKVTDNENALLSLNGVASLLGFTKGQEFFAVYRETNSEGYTHYTYQQRYGGITIAYSTLRIFVDPEGYVCALQNSFVPELGIENPKSMTNAEAEAIIKQILDNNELSVNIYSEYTKQVFYYDYDHIVNCMVVYTDNPFMTASFDMPYMAFYVDIDNQQNIAHIPTSNFEVGNGNIDEYNTAQYFEQLEPKTWSGTVKLYNGQTEQITVPVGYNPNDGLYYLADKDRNIACSDYWSFVYKNRKVLFVTSENNQDWDNEFLLAYYNYIRVYDYFAGRGLKSIDGFGMPILLGVDYCDKEGNPIDNCAYMGRLTGWAFFAAQSYANYKNQTIDLICHEYTHGIRDCSMGSSIYMNELGAIHEAFSDVIGQLVEYELGATTDTQWNLGENSGDIWRNMANPNMYNQPGYVGDLYYVAPTKVDDDTVNDHGGVHVNASLMSAVCYKLSLYGMSNADQLNVWYNVLEVMTPRGDYDDLYASIVFSLGVYGLSQYAPAVTTIFDELGLSGDRIANASNATKAGCGRVRIHVSDKYKDYAIAVHFFTNAGLHVKAYPDERDSVIECLLPAGRIDQVAVIIRYDPSEGYYRTALGPDGSFFAAQEDAAAITITEGQTLDLGTIE